MNTKITIYTGREIIVLVSHGVYSPGPIEFYTAPIVIIERKKFNSGGKESIAYLLKSDATITNDFDYAKSGQTYFKIVKQLFSVRSEDELNRKAKPISVKFLGADTMVVTSILEDGRHGDESKYIGGDPMQELVNRICHNE